jgi:hypothetical protein
VSKVDVVLKKFMPKECANDPRSCWREPFNVDDKRDIRGRLYGPALLARVKGVTNWAPRTGLTPS